MNRQPAPDRAMQFRILLACLVVAGVLLALLWRGQNEASSAGGDGAPSEVPRQNALSASSAAKAAGSGTVDPAAMTTPDTTPGTPVPSELPLRVAIESSNFQWTAEDATDTNVLRRIAHNELEYQRMLEENSRIQRRQLVYSKNTAAAVMQRSRLTGEPVAQLVLPGFDGQEHSFIIERADLEPSKQAGMFTGHLAGHPGSIVTLAFKFGRESFTILSPDNGTFLQGHPREPGQIIVTSFDPDTYIPLPGGEPILTSEQK